MMKRDVINGIVGSPSPSGEQCVELTKLGLMRFNGNQWGESWAWRRLELDKLDLQGLRDIYDALNQEQPA